MERQGDLSKADLVEIVLETGNSEYIEINSQSSSNSLSLWDLSSLSDMDVDYNSSADDNSFIRRSPIWCSRTTEQKHFFKLFKDKKKYPNANSIAISEKNFSVVEWNFLGFTVITLRKENFQAIKEESLSLQNKKWGQNIQMLFLSCSEKTQIWRYLRLPISCKKNNIDVSRMTIRRALTESGYKFVGPIIKTKKILWRKGERDLTGVWCK